MIDRNSAAGETNKSADANEVPLLIVQGLKKYFPQRGGLFGPKTYKKAVDDISFDVRRGRTLALVGESGSGKSTVGLMLLDLLEPTGGEIIYDGRPFSYRRGKERLDLRREMQVVFQDPYASLNARMNVRETLTEGMIVHKMVGNAAEREVRAIELLKQVSMPADALDRYPHEFSGGQRQRIAIARAVVLRPEVLVLDEPTSALDVSVQRQVLALLAELQRKHGMSYVFISHDLAVVRAMSHRVLVMKDGDVVEEGEAETLFAAPREPYTRALLAAAQLSEPGAALPA